MKVALVKPPITGHLQRGTGKYFELLISTINHFYSEKIQLFVVDYGHFNERDFDLIHYPYFDPFFLTLPLRFIRPTIITVHDLIPLRFSKYYPRGLRGEIKWQVQKRLLNKSSAILTDSQASKKDIIAFTNIGVEKIKVVYLAVSENFKPLELSDPSLKRVREKFQLPRQFILYAGDVNYSKNVNGLIRAVSVLEQRRSPTPLLLAGQVFADNEVSEVGQIKGLIKKFKLEPMVKFIGFVPEDELVALYNLATVYCQPSFCEGFGLPVLEAMRSGCPVVHSGKGSLVEIVGEAGLIVNIDDTKDMANGLRRVITSVSRQKKLRKQGLLQAKKFTLQKFARRTVNVYRSLVK